MEKQNVIMAEYAVYTFEDMEMEEKVQAMKANNVSLSPAIRRDALDRLEVIEVVKMAYMKAAENGANILGMRFDVAFYLTTGTRVEQCRAGAITQATKSFVSATDKIADVTVESVRSGLNRFAGWLGNKTSK